MAEAEAPGPAPLPRRMVRSTLIAMAILATATLILVAATESRYGFTHISEIQHGHSPSDGGQVGAPVQVADDNGVLPSSGQTGAAEEQGEMSKGKGEKSNAASEELIAIDSVPASTQQGEIAPPLKEATANANAGHDDDTTQVSDTASQNRRLVYILPADNPGPSLCKVIFSGMALGYPSPVVVNWQQDFREHGLTGSHLMKITGTLEYLDAITRETTHEDDRLEDDDLVVLMDAYDVWWQLPPQVMINRYLETNKAANERLAAQWEGDGEMPMHQTIVASAQKRCWPNPSMPYHLHCDALPTSPMRSDLYGEATDTPPEESTNPNNVHHEVRPRYLNSGSIIGPVGDMKRYLRRAEERMRRRMSEVTDLWSDQGVFAELWGEQEMWRTWRRKLQKNGGLPDDEMTTMTTGEFEFHVGLDYTQTLFIPTVFEEEDGEIISLNNHTRISERSRELGISPVRLTGVPDDLKQIPIPLRKVVDKSQQDSLDWGEMPLYADFFSEAVPVAVHHNAHAGGVKGRNTWWWDLMWYSPYLRALVLDYLQPPAQLQPVARVQVQGEDTAYWPLASDKTKRRPRVFQAGEQSEGLPELFFHDICVDTRGKLEKGWEWHDEVFRDGKGPI
ncbi:hypothetical protein S7711_07492 [Stachybotrys chartarum IBT 7711]|uniref:Uncharacterized protein n=1 Tax=Stachybotrys chartarum (strain CBS 109288 / IBT 7711) TaxID=1280523 RepID=A0A084B7D7_STACB|nr:hypothetical protein S7711_07492 [Stachybotrys chartarum IBT 7711]